MNRYADIELHISHHAHQQYCDRVETIEAEVLQANCAKQLRNKEYGHNKDWFIHLAGVWWVFNIEDNRMTFITCYGKTNMNVPKALKWEKVNKDRIDLNNTV